MSAESGRMRVEVFPLGQSQSNTYLLAASGRAVLIDAGENPDPVLDYLQAHDLKLTHILLTHRHFDHVAGLPAVTAATGATVLASPADAYLYGIAPERGGYKDLPGMENVPLTPLSGGRLDLLDRSCLALATPGHTPGGMSYYFPGENRVFTGDLIFRLNVGRCDLEGGDESALTASIRLGIFALPLTTLIHPGHGPETSVRFEWTFSPFVGEKAGQTK